MDVGSEKTHQDSSRGEEEDKRCFSGSLIEATADISLWQIGWHGETEWHQSPESEMSSKAGEMGIWDYKMKY